MKRLLGFFLLLLIMSMSLVCYAGENVNGIISSQPITAKDGSVITAEEREMIRGLVPFFTAITNKDITKMKQIDPGMRGIPDDQLLEKFSSIKSYTLHGLEDVTFIDGTLKATMIYSAEIVKPDTIGINIAPFISEVSLTRSGDIWMISSWQQIKGAADDMTYFRDMLGRMNKAEKRYGVKDLAKWDGL